MKRIFIMASMIAFCFSLPSNAQFLNKLGKKLKEAEKKLDKALDKTTEGTVKGSVAVGKYVFTDDETNADGNKKTTTASGKSGTNADAGKLKTNSEQRKKEDLSEKEPFTFDGTKYLDTEELGEVREVTGVHHGVFAIKGTKGYVFYRISGHKFIDGEWLTSSDHAPLMTPQGVIVRKADAKYGDPLYLITPDALAKPLPKTIKSATNFVDGLAIAKVGVAYQYIDGNCQVVYPNIHPTPRSVDGRSNSPAPVCDGRRAFVTKNPAGYGEVWGFIDTRGKIVIEPQFREVRSFSDGLALVTNQKGEIYFINTEGTKAFEPQWGEKTMNTISDYDSGICALVGLNTTYYDKQGKKLDTKTAGTRFHNGTAYYTKVYEADNKEYAYKIQTGFGEGTRLSNRDLRRTNPGYDAYGFAHFGERIVIDGPGNPDYFFEYSIGGFTKDGYAKAYMQANTGNKYYRGFIDTGGNFVLIYYINDTSVK